MSSEWVKAGKYWEGYTQTIYSYSGKSRGIKREKLPTSEPVTSSQVSDIITRATMRELCLISHDSGLVMVSHTELAKRVGVSYHAIKRAIKRLSSDGYLVLVRRGTGSPHLLHSPGYANARVNAYLLARLKDTNGYELPTSEYLERAFLKLVTSPRYLGFKKESRQELTRLVTELYEFK